MSALFCDICSGKLIVQAGGTVVCDACGMEYTAERMKEKIQEAKKAEKSKEQDIIQSTKVYKKSCTELKSTKAVLEEEKKELEKRYAILEDESRFLPEEDEADEAEDHMRELNIELNALGFFKITEKAALKEKLAVAYDDWRSATDRLMAKQKEYEKKMAAIKREILLVQEKIKKIEVEISNDGR